MPFGSFNAVPRQPKAVSIQQVPLQPSTSPSGTEQKVGRKDYNVTLIARTQAQAKEYLCSMNQNMNDAVTKSGLSFYIPDLQTMRQISEQKKRIDSFFRAFSQEDWAYPLEEGDGFNIFRFELSPIGLQRKSIRLNIRTVAGHNAEPGEYDALWMLADGTSLTPARAAGDLYTLHLRELLGSLPKWNAQSPRPVCLILTQFEAADRENGVFQQNRSGVLSDSGWQSVFAGATGPGTLPAVIFARVFGGLTFDRTDENHAPILRLDSHFQTYEPSACHIPFLYSLQASAGKHKNDYFFDVMEGGLENAILSCYEAQYSNPSWRPFILEGGEAT